MKKIFITICALLLVTISMFNCSRTNMPNELSEDRGSVSIKFDKVQIPISVTNIAVYLTRENYKPITRNLVISDNTSTEITIYDIIPGTWHLKIEASDQFGVILYAGETDVYIKSVELTSISLTLQPTGKLTIQVNWENQIGWRDNPGNPILSKLDNNTPYGLYFGRVLFDENKFKMWFSNSYGSDKYDIGYAESLDGVSWQIVKQVVIGTGAPGSWDSYGVHSGAVIKEGNLYKMYFTGQSESGSPSKRIGLATSYDGINWMKSSEAIVDQIDLTGYSTDILKVNGVYYLYYGNSDIIGVAISTDGYTWYKSNKSVVEATESWEGERLLSCTVIHENGKFKMLYSNSRLYDKFGYAESDDGTNWTKRKTPVFSFEETYNLWPFDIRYPFLRKIGNTYYIFYSTVSPSYECKIGVAFTSTL
ncbi:MAG: hypothetical protein AB1521_09735 [Bacteroidota bacterium]